MSDGPPAPRDGPWPEVLALAGGLELRRWRVEHAEAMAAAVAANMEHLKPWIADEPTPLATRRVLLTTWEEAWERGTDRHFGIFEGDAAVGSIGVMGRRGRGRLEIGYWLDHRRTGRGIATAAARALTTAALASPGIRRVEIHHDRDNQASAGVPRRLGFSLVDEVAVPIEAPGESGLEWIWEMRAERWTG